MRPDSCSETSQVNSSCLDASYEHAHAFQLGFQFKQMLVVSMLVTHAQPSLLRESCLSPISFFSRREATIHGVFIQLLIRQKIHTQRKGCLFE